VSLFTERLDLLVAAAVLDLEQFLGGRSVLWLVGQARLHRVEQPLRNHSVAGQDLAPLGEADPVIGVGDACRLLTVVFDVLKGRAAVKQAVQHATQRPDVTFEVDLQAGFTQSCMGVFFVRVENKSHLRTFS
jgi:hypothetical protein